MSGTGRDAGTGRGANGGRGASRQPGEHIVSFEPKDVASQRRVAFGVASAAYGLFRLTSKMRIENAQALPVGRGTIVAAYHANHLDPILVGLAVWRSGRLPHFLAKSTLFSGPLGVILKGLGQIPVLRASAQAGDSLEYAKEALQKGETVVIYPEGTLTKDEHFWPERFKSGTARLALETGAPIVPAAHWGLETVKPRGRLIPRPRPLTHTSVVRFGEPLDYTDLWEHRGERSSMATLTTRLTNTIAGMVADLSGRELPERFRTEEAGS